MKWLNIGVKLALVALLLLAVVFPDWPQFEGKGIAARLIMYPLAGLIVPLVWLIAGTERRAYWRSRWGYPYWTDILLTAPFMLDTLGNALNLFDTIEWWDDWMHFANWVILCAGIGSILARTRVGAGASALIVLGMGSFIAVLWELAEYYAFIRTSVELQTAYTDTLGDLVLGSTGGALAALGTFVVLRRLSAQGGGREHHALIDSPEAAV